MLRWVSRKESTAFDADRRPNQTPVHTSLLCIPTHLDAGASVLTRHRLLTHCKHASNIDQHFREHGTVNQMVASLIGVQSGRRFTHPHADQHRCNIQKSAHEPMGVLRSIKNAAQVIGMAEEPADTTARRSVRLIHGGKLGHSVYV